MPVVFFSGVGSPRALFLSFDGGTMRKLSRWMPDAPVRKFSFRGHSFWVYLITALILASFFYFAYLLLTTPVLLAIFLVLFLIACWRWGMHEQRMRELALKRSAEDISSFVRDFDIRRTDTWVIRAVYEELSRWLQVDDRPFPIHADNRWEEDLKIDSEDMDKDILPDIAYRAGRSLEDTEKNPYYGRVKTIRDIVGFLEYQPRLQSVEQTACTGSPIKTAPVDAERSREQREKTVPAERSALERAVTTAFTTP